MTITPEEIRRIAALAALEIGDEELPKLARELDAIVRYVGQLDGADGVTEGFLPGPQAAPLRADVPDRVPLAGPITDFAPEVADGFFLVPRLAGRGDG